MIELTSAHRYDNAGLSSTGTDSLSYLIRWVPEKTKVLDVGTGPGSLGAYLSNNLRCTVDGIEVNDEFIARAKPSYRNIFREDLESTDWIEKCRHLTYDRIICADVLEHLRNPAFVLKQLATLLTKDGKVLISCPNVAYAGLVAELVGGEFRYRESGLLDETHVRFYTLSSLAQLIHDCGMRITNLERVILDPAATEFGAQCFENLPYYLAETICELPEAFTYQFIVEATRDSGEAPAEVSLLPSKPIKPASAQFMFQAYWAPASEDFTENRSMRKLLPVGGDIRVVDFELPDELCQGYKLRLDPSDKPGQISLYNVSMLDKQGNTIWSWNKNIKLFERSHSVQILSQNTATGISLLLKSSDAHFELLIPEEIIAFGKTLRVITSGLSWREMQIAEERVDNLLKTLQQEKQASVEQISLLETDLSFARQKLAENLKRLNELQSSLECSNEKVLERDRQLHDLSLVIEQATQQLAALEARFGWEKAHSEQKNARLERVVSALKKKTANLGHELDSAKSNSAAMARQGIESSALQLSFKQVIARCSQELTAEQWFSPLFDPAFYLLQNPDVMISGLQPSEHYLQSGVKEHRNPCALFDAKFYLEQYADIDPLTIEPLRHFLEVGAFEGRQPHRLFDTKFLLAEHDRLRLLGENPLIYYRKNGLQEKLKPHLLFDADFYLAKYGDCLSDELSPLEHYLKYSRQRNLDPHPLFDADHYVQFDPALLGATYSPLEHYLKYGDGEGRNPHVLFDCNYYRQRYQDVSITGLSSLEHYLRFGSKEGRDPHPLFDTAFYLETNLDVADSQLSPLEHFLKFGKVRKLSPHPLFDTSYYLACSPAAQESELNPLVHYLKHGAANGVNPHPLFNTEFYIESNPDLFDATISPLEHYITIGARQNASPCLFFDPAYYVDRYPEADGCATTPLGNFVTLGLRKRRNPNAFFDTDYYLETHPEVLRKGINPLVHFLSNKVPLAATASPLFDGKYYINQYPDVADSGLSALEHYLSVGRAEKRNPHKLFDTQYYLRNNQDVRNAGADPIEHYLKYGDNEQRNPSSEFDVAFYLYQYRDVLDSNYTALEHYLRFGKKEGRKCSRQADSPSSIVLFDLVQHGPVLHEFDKLRVDGKPTILFISHIGGGGLDKHIHELVQKIQDKCHVFLLRPTNFYKKGTSYKGTVALSLISDRDQVSDFEEHNHRSTELCFDPVIQGETLAFVIKLLGVSRICIHHIWGNEGYVEDLIERLGVPFDTAVHDFYALLPQVDVTNGSNIFDHDIDLYEVWPQKTRWLFEDAERVLVPSLDTKQRIEKYFPGLSAIAAPYKPYKWDEIAGQVLLPKLAPSQRMKIVSFGQLAPYKGGHVFDAVAELAAKRGLPIDFHLVGQSDTRTAAGKFANVTVTGAYEVDELFDVVRGVAPHLIWLPFQWPETFSYTLSEAFIMNLPLLVSKIGAIPERVAGRGWTWVVDSKLDAGQLCELLLEIKGAIEQSIPPAIFRSANACGVVTDFYENDALFLGPLEAATGDLHLTAQDRFAVQHVEIGHRGEAGPPADSVLAAVLNDIPVNMGDVRGHEYDGIYCAIDFVNTPKVGLTEQFTANAELYHERYQDIDHFRKLLGEAAVNLRIPPSPIILDVGSGSGNTVFAALDLFPSSTVIATDLSENLLLILKKHADANPLYGGRLSLLCQDACVQSLKTESVDLVVGAAILHHLIDPHLAVMASLNSLKRGGSAVFFEPFENGASIMRLAFREILEKNQTRVNGRLDSDVEQFLQAIDLDFSVRTGTDKTAPLFKELDDKWLFTRDYFERLADQAGVSKFSLYPISHSQAPFSVQMLDLLRLGLARKEDALPRWAWDIVRFYDDSFSQKLKRELFIEGCVIFTK